MALFLLANQSNPAIRTLYRPAFAFAKDLESVRDHIVF
jgi:hypothetical protein